MKKKILRIHMFIRANKIILFLSDQYHRPIITYFPQFFYPFILKKQYTIYQNIYIYFLRFNRFNRFQIDLCELNHEIHIGATKMEGRS